jgi:hypothetical protein
MIHGKIPAFPFQEFPVRVFSWHILTLVATAALAGPGPSPGLLKALARNSATVVVVEPASGGVRAAFLKLVEEDALVDLDLSLLESGWFQGSPENRAWIGGLLGTGGWAVLDAAGRVVDQGVQAPAAAALAARLDKAGVQGPVRALTLFLKGHPEHQEARAELIPHLRSIAARRTGRVLALAGPKTPDPAPGITFSPWTGAGLEPVDRAGQLPPEQDILLWGTAAQEVERLFQDPAWSLAPVEFKGLAEAHSPTMQAVLRRHISQVQALLASRPGNHKAWMLWVWMHQVVGLRPDLGFLKGLHPLPEELQTHRNPGWPPPQVVSALVGDARSRGDWALARDVLLAQFEVEQPPREDRPAAPVPKPSLQVEKVLREDQEETWKGLYEPLLEALVRTGEEAQAMGIARRLAGEPWLSDLRGKLKVLAARLGRKDLAQAWTRFA